VDSTYGTASAIAPLPPLIPRRPPVHRVTWRARPVPRIDTESGSCRVRVSVTTGDNIPGTLWLALLFDVLPDTVGNICSAFTHLTGRRGFCKQVAAAAPCNQQVRIYSCAPRDLSYWHQGPRSCAPVTAAGFGIGFESGGLRKRDQFESKTWEVLTMY